MWLLLLLGGIAHVIGGHSEGSETVAERTAPQPPIRQTCGFPVVWRCRVQSVGPPPKSPPVQCGLPNSTEFRFGGSQAMVSLGTGWSAIGNFSAADAAAHRKQYPNVDMPAWWRVLVTKMTVLSKPAPIGTNGSLTKLQCELTPHGGAAVTVAADLFGSSLGLMLAENTTTATMPTPVMTMADFNTHRYEPAFAAVRVTTPPKLFPVADRCIGGDADWNDWASCVRALSSLGLHGIETDPPNRFDRRILQQNGQDLTSGGIYSPPGAEPDSGVSSNASYMTEWGTQQFAKYFAAGFNASEITTFALADEPGWYFPAESPEHYIGNLSTAASRAVQQEWIRFLQLNKITASDFGQTGTPVPSVKRWQLPNIAAKRLFYWSARFGSWSSAQAFSRATAALERATRPGLPIYVNFNNFAGRGYVAGPVGHNRDATDPDAAMGSLDWFEFGRARGATLLWTEDWFGDSKAVQWGYYSARLRAAARLAPTRDVVYGGYIVPRAGGQSPDGLLQKAAAIVGSGGKALKFYVFGPEYNFPGNCYSEDLLGNPGLLRSMARATGMIGAAEPLLWPAERTRAQVGIIYPRSSFYWDDLSVADQRGYIDCTNTNMDSGPDYQSEVHALYMAIAVNLNIPVDFLDEDQLTTATELAPFKVLVLTEPDLPLAAGATLLAWVKAGGTLITVAGAGGRDRYDEPSPAFQTALLGYGAEALKPRASLTKSLANTVNGSLANPLPSCGNCTFEAWGNVTRPASAALGTTTALATFDTGQPAIVSNVVGTGRSVHFYFFPGLSSRFGYRVAETAVTLQAVLAAVISAANVAPPVVTSAAPGNPNPDIGAGVETPHLVGPNGTVVTLLNWSGRQFNSTTGLLSLNVTLGFVPGKVISVEHGAIAATPVTGPAATTVALSLPLGSVDFLLFYK